MVDESIEGATIELATQLTMAWLANPSTRVSAEEVPGFLHSMHAAVQNLSSLPVRDQPDSVRDYTPAVSVRKSLASKDRIISMIDGKPYKTLRRHLSRHGLTPEQYRERYGLKSDYPMVSENYSQTRRDLARKFGLGRKPVQKAGPNGQKPPRKPKASPAQA